MVRGSWSQRGGEDVGLAGEEDLIPKVTSVSGHQDVGVKLGAQASAPCVEERVRASLPASGYPSINGIEDTGKDGVDALCGPRGLSQL